jgi:hypothetical protein
VLILWVVLWKSSDSNSETELISPVVIDVGVFSEVAADSWVSGLRDA